MQCTQSDGIQESEFAGGQISAMADPSNTQSKTCRSDEQKGYIKPNVQKQSTHLTRNSEVSKRSFRQTQSDEDVHEVQQKVQMTHAVADSSDNSYTMCLSNHYNEKLNDAKKIRCDDAAFAVKHDSLLSAAALPQYSESHHLQPSSSSTNSTLTDVGCPFVQGDTKPRPFVNLMNSCYINAGIMACFGVSTFRKLWTTILDDHNHRLMNTLWPAAINPAATVDDRISEIKDRSTTHEERLPVTYKASRRPPSGIAMVPRLITNQFYDFGTHQQQDVMEFLESCVLDEDKSPQMRAACTGIDAPMLACKTCGWARNSAGSPFVALSVPLKTPSGKIIASAQAALNEHMRPEEVIIEWSCGNPDCCEHGLTDKLPMRRQHILMFPQVLIVHLKRWQLVHSDRSETSSLLYPVEPERSIHLQEEAYQLRSIICHLGPFASHGHYTCRIYHPTPEGNWWYYNDNMRRVAHERDLLTNPSEKSYVLIYEKT